MKLRFILSLLCLIGSMKASGAFTYSWSSGFANNGNVPDANTTGWFDTRALGGLPSSITDVNVTLNISGGFNGDLYVYLSHDGGFSVLLNRVGRTSMNAFGYGDAGFQIRLSDQAVESTDIHLYRTVNDFSVTGGTEWRPDGRNVNPQTALDTDARTAFLASFNGLDPNGNWTLFVADLSGGGSAQVVSWGLEIAAVPEPTTEAASVFAGIVVVLSVLRRWMPKLRGRRAG